MLAAYEKVDRWSEALQAGSFSSGAEPREVQQISYGSFGSKETTGEATKGSEN